ncbi:hypothetical protein [Helicobacter pylori]
MRFCALKTNFNHQSTNMPYRLEKDFQDLIASNIQKRYLLCFRNGL